MPVSEEKTPFFIVGAPRAGTTLLREILRTHSELCCPAETHFFRWGHPFGGTAFRDQYFAVPSNLAGTEPIYRLHRALDGVGDNEFSVLLDQAKTRAGLQDAYFALYQKRNGLEGKRWFDKSPQNVYGIFLLNALYKRPQFIHLVRNPLDVVASLMVGEDLRADGLIEACNYWLEAVAIFNQFKAAWPAQSFELKFERFAKHPEARSRISCCLSAKTRHAWASLRLGAPRLAGLPNGLVGKRYRDDPGSVRRLDAALRLFGRASARPDRLG